MPVGRLGLETSGGLGHEPQHEWGDVAWRAGAPGGCLDRRGELVEGEVVGAADLEYVAAGRGVGHGMFGQRGDVCHGDEVDRVVPPSEEERSAQAGSGLAERVDPQLEERGGPHDRPADPAGPQVLFGGMLHPEQLHRAVRYSAGDQHQHQLSARGFCGLDQVDVALVIDRGRGHAPRPGEPVDRGHDHTGTVKGRRQAGAVAHVAGCHLDAQRGEMAGPRRVSGQDAYGQPVPGQPGRQGCAKPASAAGEEDHLGPPGATCRCTAASASPSPAWTGSR